MYETTHHQTTGSRAVTGMPYDDDADELTDLEEQDPEGEGGMFEHFRFVADKGQQLLRVDKFLVDHLQKSSRNRIQQAAEAGCILANGKPVKSNYRVKPDDVISVVMDRPRYEFEIIAEDIPLDIVYEDDDLLVVNKPAGLVVHPGHGNYSGTLVNALAWHFRNTPDYDVSDPRLGLVHRIDKDTSGLLVVAKTPDAKTNLGKQFFNKTTQREYVALVWGIPPPRQRHDNREYRTQPERQAADGRIPSRRGNRQACRNPLRSNRETWICVGGEMRAGNGAHTSDKGSHDAHRASAFQRCTLWR